VQVRENYVDRYTEPYIGYSYEELVTKFTDTYIRYLYINYLESYTEPYVRCLCAKYIQKFTQNYIYPYNHSSYKYLQNITSLNLMLNML
jgi:hypothetical protein